MTTCISFFVSAFEDKDQDLTDKDAADARYTIRFAADEEGE